MKPTPRAKEDFEPRHDPAILDNMSSPLKSTHRSDAMTRMVLLFIFVAIEIGSAFISQTTWFVAFAIFAFYWVGWILFSLPLPSSLRRFQVGRK